MKCQGECEKHLGEVRHVRVVGKSSGHDWGWFDLCEQAVLEDKVRGFEVTTAGGQAL